TKIGGRLALRQWLQPIRENPCIAIRILSRIVVGDRLSQNLDQHLAAAYEKDSYCFPTIGREPNDVSVGSQPRDIQPLMNWDWRYKDVRLASLFDMGKLSLPELDPVNRLPRITAPLPKSGGELLVCHKRFHLTPQILGSHRPLVP